MKSIGKASVHNYSANRRHVDTSRSRSLAAAIAVDHIGAVRSRRCASICLAFRTAQLAVTGSIGACLNGTRVDRQRTSEDDYREGSQRQDSFQLG